METLSEYVLRDIFEFLDVQTLITCTEVCKGWNEIINKSPLLDGKLTLSVGDEDSESEIMQVMEASKRRYSSMTLAEIEIDSELWSFLTRFQLNLDTLELTYVEIDSSTFCEVLKSATGTLKTLRIYDCTLTSSEPPVERVQMPSLKTLLMNGSTFKFIDHIVANDLRRLEFINCEYDEDDYARLPEIVDHFGDNIEDLNLYQEFGDTIAVSVFLQKIP